MNLYLEKVGKEDWSTLSEVVHRGSFGVERDASMDRIDYALVTKRENELMTYATIIEIDAKSAYMQHGGNFTPAEKNPFTLRSYLMILDYLREQYESVTTRIWNKRKAMLKLALTGGFEITGIEVSKDGDIFLIHELEMKRHN